jgi:hypothetical protein
MGDSRRTVFLALLASAALRGQAPDPQDPQHRNNFPPHPGEGDVKLPNGKSQKDAIAKQNHEQALKDAQALVDLAQQLKDDIDRAGQYVVPVSALKKTEEVEKLAKRIRGRLRT